MKVLFICMFPVEANNSAMMRNLALVNGLLSNKCEVDFVTITASENVQAVNKNEKLDGFNIIKLKGNDLYNTVTSVKNGGKSVFKSLAISILRKVYHKVTIYDHTLKIAQQIDINRLNQKEYDLVISSSDPKTSHIAAINLMNQGLKYKKWIQYWGDPMAMDITNRSIYPNLYLRSIERKLLKDADQIIYVSPCTYEAQKQTFPELAEKMSFVPIPYREQRIYPETKNAKFLIGYFGAYMKISRNLEPLYTTCDHLRQNIDLIIMGESDCEFAEKENITVYPRGNISEYEAKADLLVCVLNKVGTQIPGKIYHYAATNKPILIILDGENKETIRTYLEPYNRYIFCENNKEDIERIIKEIIEHPVQYNPCKAFDSRMIAERILEL
ncbi:glycosyltransferase family 4 protein [Sporosarcina sp. ANT_H38]|uniref:glycosyltransferase family 4 protein n=1 Tax=Sporosarcina sp. ANT_H38 TaxID=2597358 RepID=UPI0011F290AF|nr:glycosyltransferase family 4 protein [Sporosarcina sp. ANT_H38]KAA0955536.1 glycosyltransferase family 4 protein [Sporosarcina sp. ANT_H38]